ncbi:hypothetical protein BT93_F2745 [Corymbia citriodora subsp. variegata]|nr:hypothetical protein BT93_F2745 [Corymbia citriodora subsp. variegata]
MAAVAEISNEAAVANKKLDSKPNSKPESEFTMQNLVDMFTKLNPSAKEFIPSYYSQALDHHQQQQQLLHFQQNGSFLISDFPPAEKNFSENNFANNRRRRNSFNQGRRRFNGRSFRAQGKIVTEEQLATLFSACGQVLDCRICGDPHSVLRFAFVEFADEYGARAALNLGGTMLGYYPVRVLPSKTAILPVNPSYLPRMRKELLKYLLLGPFIPTFVLMQSEDEREMCTRTVYCTNIDKKISQAEVKNFFETACGEVTRLRLLGDHVHSTRIAFVEFARAESAIVALNCSGMVLGTQPIRVSPSKTPVRPRVTRPPMN